MFKYLSQIWKAKDLRKKILFTCFILVIYRFIAHVTVPGINQDALNFEKSGLGFLAMLTGGSFNKFSIVLMGLGPYINASIIMQLLTVVVPKLESLSKEGEQGRNKISRYTRFVTLPLAFVQSYGMILLLNASSGGKLINISDPFIILPAMLFVTTGTLLIMWLGELITQKGIGNGISLIIFTGIVSNIHVVLSQIGLTSMKDTSRLTPFIIFTIITLLMLFIIIMFTEGHRNIPITYSGRGTRGGNAGLPIRINQAGMIPIIFAISMISFPTILSTFFKTSTSEWLKKIANFIDIYLSSQNPSYLYIIMYFLLVLAFSYFYVSITFDPNKVSENLQKRGGFIPGIRPGKETSKFLGKVSNHLNLFGGSFLAIVAITPIIFTKFTTLSSNEMIISGSGLIIVVGVVLELIRQINAQLIMHDYDKLV